MRRANIEMNKQRLIVVLGMHRSGTSAITRGLQVLGVRLGDRLIPPIEGINDRGFFEDIDLNALNNEMLQALGNDWHYLSPIEASDVEALRKKGYFLRAVELLRQKVGNAPIFGFKDPRVAKLLPFWKQVFAHCQFDLGYVLAVRHPLSVVKSLAKRDGFDYEKSYMLWLGHVLTSLSNTEGHKRVLVDYDCLMHAPERELERIAECLALQIDPGELQRYKSEFLDEGLRHTVYDLGDLLLDDTCPPLVREIYTALLDIAADKRRIDDAALENHIALWINEFERLKSNLRLVDRLFGQIASLNQAIAERDAEVAGLNQAIAERDAQITSLNQAVANRDGQIASLNQVVAEREAQIASLNQAVAEREAQIASLNQTIAERDGQIAAILASRSWRITKPLRVFRRSLIMRPYWFFRCLMSESVRWIWRHLPIPDQRKQKIKSVMFKGLPFLFGWTQAYRNWQSFNCAIDRSAAVHISAASTAQKTSTDSEYVPLLKAPPLKNKPVKLICFYLPQFHPIPENDVWWGEGFTEWTNVLPAQPQFVGHYQPHLPDDLGCYSLLDPAVQRRQIELAKLYGIEGFCFYFYWFDGKRLLETPIQNYLNDNSLDLPFCLCWANENWTRRWDGLDSEILIAQQHSPEDDLAFIRHVAQYMRDPRYIRIDGKPLLLVYRPSLLPSAKDTAKRWRNWCRENGIGEIYLAYTQSFKTVDPAKYGFDAAVEFPPNNSAPPNITNSVTPLREDFGCTVYDWRVFVERSEKYQRPRYKLFRSVCPSWDNTARRKNRSTVFLNSSPALYQRWLENAIRDTLKHQTNPDERLVFINAWNEWAEGAHLEPDQRYGYAWLQATRDALVAVATTPRRIVVVSHDAHPHGAQLLALHMARELCQLGFSVDMIVLGNGVLLSKFQQVASVHRINLDREPSNQVLKRLRVLCTNGAEVAIVNTTVSGRVIPLLKQAGFVVVSLIHELPGILNSYQLHEHARAIADNSDCIVFPAAQVKAGFEDFVGHLLKQAVIRPQGLYLRSPLRTGMDRELIRSKIRKQLGLASDTRIILSAGYADYRKGLDLFIDACLKVINQNPKVVALWVGHVDQKLMDQQMAKIDAAGVQNRFIFPGRVDQPQEYFIAADVYALTSREDPFPSVVLEAYDALTPVVAFKGCGGFEEFLKRDCGVLVPAFDIDVYAKELMNLIEDQDTARRYAEQGRAIVEREFSFRHYLFDLLEFAGKPLPRVSVILPNYNYGRYLTERLSTIVRQTVPIYELIVLDDASTDDSLQIARDFLAKCDIPSVLVVNERNSGSVFSQWIRGVDLARGDFVWIAEADDLADPEFLESVLPAFQRPDVVMSYAQSRQMAEDGTILCEHYLDYVADIDRERWTRPYVVDGKEEIKKALYLKNTIPNVSAVVFRRNVLAATLKAHAEEITSFRFAGDWVLYLRLLEQGAVAFCPLSLNSHRRHQRGVTIGGFGLQQLQEIIEVQRDTIQRFELDAQASLKASAYAQRLYEQFGFANHTHPTIQDHPEFEKLMYI